MTALVVLAGAVLGGPTGSAQAHGGPPRTRSVVFHPTDPDRLTLQTSYGLVLSDDGGEGWRWVCPQAAAWGVGEDPPFLVTADGATLAALFAGLSRGEASGCSWSFPSSELEGTFIADVVQDPGDLARILAVESNGVGVNRLWESEDGGRTWAPTEQEGRPVLYERLRFAPSDPSRAYLSGGVAPTRDRPRTGIVYRSDDGGRTFPDDEATDIALSEASRAVRVLAVSPIDPEVVFLHVTAFDAPDELRRSDDGGRTWETVLEMTSLSGIAVDPDGDTVWATGLDGGLQRSTDAGRTFEPVDPDLDALCVEVHDGAVYVCGRVDFQGFGLARSTDGGATFETVFADEADPAACPEASEAGQICPDWLIDFCVDLDRDEAYCPDPGLIDAGPANPIPGTFPDAGAMPPSEGGGGGGCRIGAGRTPRLAPVALPFLAVAGLAFSWRWRRRRR
jgi:hypothetical protein